MTPSTLIWNFEVALQLQLTCSVYIICALLEFHSGGMVLMVWWSEREGYENNYWHKSQKETWADVKL